MRYDYSLFQRADDTHAEMGTAAREQRLIRLAQDGAPRTGWTGLLQLLGIRPGGTRAGDRRIRVAAQIEGRR